MTSPTQIGQRSRVRTFIALFGLFALVVLVSVVSALKTVTAADPASGTLNPTLGATLAWGGTPSGGTHPNNNVPGSDHDDLCVEGVNCDTYTLTISGNPGDWAGKTVDIKVECELPTTDYDLYVHKGSNAGVEVGSSGNNPGQPEEVLLNPSDTGTGIYTVHVVYFAATPADPYQGSALVIMGDTGSGTPTPTPTPSSTPASCAPPGTEITTDPTGDATLALNPAQLDITRVSIAEPASPPGDEKLSFSVDVSDLSLIPANSVWSVRFVPPGMTAPTTYYYVSAESGLTGGPGDVTYHHGRIEGSSVATSEAAEGSIDPANKRFIITAPRAVIGNPQPGQNLTDVHGVSQQQVGVLLLTTDTTRNASDLKIYTIRGNAICSAPTPTPSPGASPTPSVEPTPVPGAPSYANYRAPQGMGDSAGEPTLGANWASRKVMYIAGLEVLRVSFNDCFSPSQALWEPTNQVISNVNTADPILYTDNDTSTGFRTNRTFVSQLAAVDGSSLFEFTDNDGDTYEQGAKGSGIGSGVDHQTVGGGPYAKNPDGSYKGIGAGPITAYPNAVYYASQNIGYANLARSDNGGLNFGPAIPMYDLTACDGLHGHVKVAPDGTIYVPNKGCGGEQAVIVSEDNGTTFFVRQVPGSRAGRTDPSVGIGAPDPGTGISPIYFGYANGDGRPRIAVSRDRGLTWSDDQNVGSVHNTRSTVFPAVVAGDGDRAAFFYLGSTTPGGTDTDAQGNAPNTANGYAGTWYGFIATTYDGGKTWLTTNATPKDPVQQGVICTNGTTCPAGTRNLLDFNDITMDEKGRVLAAYADGCVTPDCIIGKDKNNDGAVNRWDNDGTDKATIIRQSGGRTLLSAFDVSGTRPPAPPLTSAFFDPDRDSVILQWETPDSEAPITGYRIYRTRGGVESLLATVGADVHTYEDTAGTPEDLYRVAAVSAAGESAASCGTIVPIVLQSPCAVPGKLVVADNADDAPNTPATPEVDLKSIYLAEPPQDDGVGRLVFTINVGGSATGQAPPNSQWYIIWNRQAPDADFDRLWVGMKSDPLGVVTFEYGKFGVPLPIPSVPNPNANTAVKIGDADAGSYNPGSGVITISVALSKLENLQVGNNLSALNARTFLSQPDTGPKSQRTAADITGEGSYVVAGTSACPTATPTPTPTPTASPTPTPDPSPTPTPSASPTPTPSASPTPTPSATPTNVQFSSASYAVTEACTTTSITITRSGDVNGATTVKYSIDNGTATQRGDFIFAIGNLVFAAGETSKSFPVLISDDGYAEGSEVATLRLNVLSGLGVGNQGTANLTINDNETVDNPANPNDNTANFVCQHYHDFLNRAPDSNGELYWQGEIDVCGSNAACLDNRRQNVSAAFFLSIEFQRTGYVVFRHYRASFPESAARPRALPRYAEFLRDTQEIQRGIIVGEGDWNTQLEVNRQNFARSWVQRADFIAEYPLGMTPDDFIEQLFTRSEVTPTTAERDAARAAYDDGGDLPDKRARALRSVIDSGSVYNKQYNPSFVLMQYFGYLRRNPNGAPDNDFSGYDFWLNKVNQFSSPGEDVRDDQVAASRVKRAEMVRAFIISDEYRGRFGGHPSRGTDQNPTQTAILGDFSDAEEKGFNPFRWLWGAIFDRGETG
ncbi:MAG TPA: Calx-beta domain-containing protein [Pyrinomonadaceae bacterium]|nr:Calx-beta domain-containing protein [Pyrinomonadaceae bacterium]